MKNVPKQNIFETPTGYFDGLPNRTMTAYNNSKGRQVWIRNMAAAAVLVVGIMLAIFDHTEIKSGDFQSSIDKTMELYIQSGYWSEEDVLSLADNPNDLLDQVLMEEWILIEWSEDEDLFNNELFY